MVDTGDGVDDITDSGADGIDTTGGDVGAVGVTIALAVVQTWRAAAVAHTFLDTIYRQRKPQHCVFCGSCNFASQTYMM